MHELAEPVPLGSTGRLEAQPLTNALGDHAILVRQGEAARALLTGEPAEGRDRVVVVPMDDEVELRVDGDALAVWLARGSVATGSQGDVPGWANAIGLLLVLAVVAFAVIGGVTAVSWLLDLAT